MPSLVGSEMCIRDRPHTHKTSQPLQSASGLYRFSASCGIHFGTSYFLIRPTPASSFSVFLSGIRKLKNVFQVTQYKTFQILVQTFPEPWARGSPSVFHFRNRQRFQVPGFEWVHELLLFCLASNPAQFCAEISCGKTGLGHNCTISISRMKNDFSG